MLRDAYGNELKVGDLVLYPTAAGRGSGKIGEYYIHSIRELSPEEQNWRDRSDYAVMLRGKPYTYYSRWEKQEVTVTPKATRIFNNSELILINNVNFKDPERQATPEEAAS